MRTKTLIFLIILSFLFPGIIDAKSAQSGNADKKCMTCHKEKSPGLYRQWAKSAHGANDITCIDFHGAKKVDIDAFMHNGHFYQYDASVHLYNEKFAKPAGEVMKIVEKNNLLTNKAAFSNKIEWTYWEIWHHEGWRARRGAAMMGPDYTWWPSISISNLSRKRGN